MGADIHFVVERKAYIGQSQRWIGVYTEGEPLVNPPDVLVRCGYRNYEAFGRLAGVRRDGPEPKGLPPDISEMAQIEIDRWGVDGHSHSWHTLADFIALCHSEEMTQQAVAAKLGAGKHPACDLLNMSPDDLDEYRVIFWFDN